jgi:hypothetical protein
MSLLTMTARERTIAAPGFNRWLVPPAALSIHLAIGEAYAFNVFNEPLTRVIGIKHHQSEFAEPIRGEPARSNCSVRGENRDLKGGRRG